MKKFLFFVFAALTFAACEQAPVEEQSAICPDVPETITVGFEGGNDTRIQLNEAQKTVWTKDDLVSVFYRSDANQKWQYTGETGARTADLTRVDAGEATATMNRVVVVYPYNENYNFNTETYNVQASLPAVQTYLEDSYGLDGNIMVSSSEYNQFKLKTVYGWLKLQLTGNGEQVKSITVRGNNGEQVAGEAYINTSDATMTLAADKLTTDDDGEVSGSLIFDNTILKEVTLNCVDGVTLGAEATAFYIALPPQTFDGGITVEIATTDGATMTKSTDNSIVIERNHIQPMTTFVYDGVRPQPNNEIWYTATAKVEPYKTDAFGATYISNVWDSETGIGVITFSGDVTKIGYNAFYNRYRLTSVTIPDSVTTIGDSAFEACYSLTSVTIGNSVTTIGYYAFRSCSSLKEFKGKFAADGGRCLIIDGVLNAFAIGCGVTQYTIPDSVTTIGDLAFYHCTSLTSVTIPDSVTTIIHNAFHDCSNLTSVTIGDSVTTIGEEAFYGCDSLKTVYCKPTTPPYGSGNMFGYNVAGLRIFVPASEDDRIINAYKAKQYWRDYADYIFEEE